MGYGEAEQREAIMTDTLETKSQLTLKFERLQRANAALTEAERALTRAQAAVGVANNEVNYAQRDYSQELTRSRTVEAMRKA